MIKYLMMAICVVFVTLFLLTGCTTTRSATNGATFCQAAHIIFWSTKDTRFTQEQIVEHNAVGTALCGWGTKKGFTEEHP